MGRNFIYIDQDSELQVLTRDLQKADRVSLDTEADSLHHYFEKVCLIQLSFAGKDYIIDPLSGVSLSRFLEALAKKPLILHGADFDLRMLRFSYGFQPKKSIFDTMVAAQILGYSQLGLAALVNKICDVKLSKQGQKSNWSKRPLTPEQLVYASDDTHYLEMVADKMAGEMKALDRVSWHEESCARVVTTTMSRQKQNPDDVWRIKGAGSLDRRALAYLRELWTWRDQQARKSDKPAFMILGNQQLLGLATWFYHNPRAGLDKGPKLPKNCRGSRLHALERAIEKARHIPQAKWPEKKKFKKSEEPEGFKKELESLRDECKKAASELKIEPSFLAPKMALKNILLQRPKGIERLKKVSGLMNWQADIVYPRIKDKFLTELQDKSS